MNYEDVRRPTLHLALWITVYFGLAFGVDNFTVVPIRKFFETESPAALVFSSLVCVYAAVWTTYFLSTQGKIFKCQTLRVLLWREAVAMNDEGASLNIRLLREKSRSTLAIQAIFIAISVFIIGSLIDFEFSKSIDGLWSWRDISTYLALALTTLSVVLLFVSADASESTFNHFRQNEGFIVQYFYRLSARRKYYGFVFSGLAILMFVSGISAEIGSFGLVTFLAFGYYQWFPDLSKNKKFKFEWILFMWMVAVFVGIAWLVYA